MHTTLDIIAIRHQLAAKGMFTWVTDPGHEWLIVTDEDLNAAGLVPTDFTPWSYAQHGMGLYALEGDCDADTFLTAYAAKTGRTPACHAVNMGDAPVRGWPRINDNYGTTSYAAE